MGINALGRGVFVGCGGECFKYDGDGNDDDGGDAEGNSQVYLQGVRLGKLHVLGL